MNLTDALRAALDAAALSPISANPRVGAVLLGADGHLLATGYHRGAGTPHAEADTLAQARAQAHETTGATCVVTLEPCAHEGRTPSCARALIDAGVARVLYAVPDPHDVASGGADMLRAAGIEALTWEKAVPGAGINDTAEAQALNRRWFAALRGERPIVTAKIAQSLDGRVAAADGTTRWITGPEARHAGHTLRGRVDAVLAGTGTVLADDPSLTARTPDGELLEYQPLRVVIGESEVPADVSVRGSDGRFLHLRTRDLRGALQDLRREHGVEHLLLEGGPRLIGAALAADLVDDLFVHLAPTVLGEGMSTVPPLGIGTLADRIDLEILPGTVRMAGRDLLLHAVPRADGTRTTSAPTADRDAARR